MRYQLSDFLLADSPETVKKGQVLFREEERPRGVFFLQKGKVKVYKLGIDGKEQIIQILKEGDLLGYRTMFSEELYPVSAQTLEEVVYHYYTKEQFLNLLGQLPELSNILLKQACVELGEMTERITIMAQQSVSERLAKALLMLNETYKREGEPGPVIINLKRDDLANIIGTATETLVRLLQQFKEEGLIESSGRKISIINVDGLAKKAVVG
jgi:CRP-like cAMP-binding protein